MSICRSQSVVDLGRVTGLNLTEVDLHDIILGLIYPRSPKILAESCSAALRRISSAIDEDRAFVALDEFGIVIGFALLGDLADNSTLNISDFNSNFDRCRQVLNQLASQTNASRGYVSYSRAGRNRKWRFRSSRLSVRSDGCDNSACASFELLRESRMSGLLHAAREELADAQLLGGMLSLVAANNTDIGATSALRRVRAALNMKQFSANYGSNGRLNAFITWALIDKNHVRAPAFQAVDLWRLDEWNDGETLVVVDCYPSDQLDFARQSLDGRYPSVQPYRLISGSSSIIPLL